MISYAKAKQGLLERLKPKTLKFKSKNCEDGIIFEYCKPYYVKMVLDITRNLPKDLSR